MTKESSFKPLSPELTWQEGDPLTWPEMRRALGPPVFMGGEGTGRTSDTTRQASACPQGAVVTLFKPRAWKGLLGSAVAGALSPVRATSFPCSITEDPRYPPKKVHLLRLLEAPSLPRSPCQQHGPPGSPSWKSSGRVRPGPPSSLAPTPEASSAPGSSAPRRVSGVRAALRAKVSSSLQPLPPRSAGGERPLAGSGGPQPREQGQPAGQGEKAAIGVWLKPAERERLTGNRRTGRKWRQGRGAAGWRGASLSLHPPTPRSPSS